MGLNKKVANPIRIGLCIPELEPGGAERCLVELATRLDRRQFDPVVYCLGPRPAGNPSSLADRLEQAGLPVVCFAARAARSAPRVLWQLERRLRADRIQLLQTFLFHANLLGAIAARRAGVQRVVSGIRVAEHASRWHLRLARWADSCVDRHVCVSQSVREFSATVGGLPAEKLLVIPNGVDVSRFATAVACPREQMQLGPGRRALLCVGRLEQQKGVDWLLSLLPTVLRQAPRHDLVVVGDGPQRGALERQAQASAELAGRVHFLGYRDDVPALLAAADLLLLPSRWEGMPNVVLEAMAAGKPVVARAVEGVAELLGPQADSQVARCQGDDAQVFSEKLLALLNDPGLACELGVQNQRRAREQFSFEAMATAYALLYRSLLNR